MNFTVHGPFEIKRNRKSKILVRKECKQSFAETLDQENINGLSMSCGCYIFGLKSGRGMTPWYVGKTNKQTFIEECFDHHKINYYNEVISISKGTPVLFLLAKKTNKDKFCKPSKNVSSEVKFLENLLIGLAINKNKNLLNIKQTNALRNLSVPGIINSPKGGRKLAVRNLLDMLK